MERQLYRIVKLLLPVVICAAGGLCQEALASRRPTPPLDPATYRSASGQYVLHVNPSARQGQGKGTYQMQKDGNEIWQKELPFTLRKARVLDDGTTVGYAYTLGPEAWGGKSDDDYGELVVAILDPYGGIRLRDAFKRVRGNHHDQLPHPTVDEFFVDSENDRLVVLLDDADWSRQNATWRQYQLSTGKLAEEFRPKERLNDDGRLYWCHEPRPLPGTTLTLVQWYRSTSNPYLKGTLFALIDMQGNPVWQRILPDDYTIPDDEAAEDLLWDWFRKNGAILSVAAKGRFELVFAKEKKRVSFVVKRDEEGRWIVAETGRKAWQLPETVNAYTADKKTAEAALEKIPQRTLQHLGVVTLSGALSAEPHGEATARFSKYSMRDTVVDDKGRFISIRQNDEKTRELVRIDQRGNEVDCVPLPPAADDESTTFSHAWLGGDRFVVVESQYGEGAKSRAWIVDFSRDEPVHLPDFSCPRVDAIAGLPDGRFFILATQSLKYTSVTTLCGYDAGGRLRWTVDEGQPSDDERLFSPDDICITPDGLIAVVETIGHKVKFFDLSGRFVRLIDLDKSWKREASYPCCIWPLPNGELIVDDAVASGGSYVRMTSEGKIISQFRLSLASGQDLPAQLIVAPDGRLWTPFGSSILELDDKGVATRAIGEPPSAERLGEIAAASMDRQGRLFLLDDATHCVHVFGGDGKRLFVCEPDPSDVRADPIGSPNVTISHTGEILVKLPGRGGYVRFSPTGERLGIEKFGRDSVTEEWHCLPGIDRRWVKCYQQIHLVDSDDKVIKTIKRRPNDDWLQYPGALAVGSDGSFVVVDGMSLVGGWPSFCLYSATGEPIQTFTTPVLFVFRLAYNGDLIATIGGDGQLFLYDSLGKALLQSNLDDYLTKDRARFIFFCPDGKELQVLDATSQTVHRFALPELE